MDSFVVTNTVQFEAAMQRLRAEIRRGTVHPDFGLLAVQGRLFAERCQQLTPPFRQKAGKNGDNSASAWVVGKRAVARDLHRVYYPISENTWNDPRLKAIIRTDNRTAWAKVVRNFRSEKTAFLSKTIAVGFSKSMHEKYRISRGRVAGLKTKKRSALSTLGMVTLGKQGKMARDFSMEKRKNVGWAKAGWNAGIFNLGGKPPPGWIAQHGTKRSAFTDGRNSSDPFIRVTNFSGWARYSKGEGERIMRNALATRARDIERYAERMAVVARDRALRGLPVLAQAPA